MMTFFFELKLRCALFLMLCNSSCRSVRNASKRQHFFLLAARKKKYLFHFVYIFDASKNFDFIFFLLLSHKIYLLSSGALLFFHGHFRCYQKLFRAKKQHKKSIYAKEEQKKRTRSSSAEHEPFRHEMIRRLHIVYTFSMIIIIAVHILQEDGIDWLQWRET